MTAAALKSEHDFWHRELIRHERECEDCQASDRCAVAQYQSDVADDYRTRWRRTEEASRLAQWRYQSHLSRCETAARGLWCSRCDALCKAADRADAAVHGWPADGRGR